MLLKTPRKTDYFTLLARQSAYSVQASQMLKETLASPDLFRLPETVDEMHRIEREADALRDTLTQSLLRDFLPPIEREDILTLSGELDDVTDMVEETLREVYMFHIDTPQPDALPLSDVVRQACEALHEAVQAFRRFKKADTLRPLLSHVHVLEEKSDALYTESVRALYGGTNDPRQLLRWTQVYGSLENCCDACAHAANAMETVMFKNT